MNVFSYTPRKQIVGVIRGGISHEYEESLASGAHVLQNIPQGFVAKDIFISRDGDWHVDGFKKEPGKILHSLDVVWNALHGRFGEDGKVQNILSKFGIPFTGSEALPSALTVNKNLARKRLIPHGFKMPFAITLTPKQNTYETLFELFRTFPQPSIIKSISNGASVGVTYADTFINFKQGIERAFLFGEGVLIEEYIPGREVTCVVVDDLSKEGSYALHPLEARRPTGFKFMTREARNTPDSFVPGDFLSQNEILFIQNLALKAHHRLGLRHYSSADFIVSPRRGIYLLEVDALPHLTPHAHIARALTHADSQMSDFVEHILTLALKK